MPRIVVVIPMFGKEEYTRKCVELTKANYGTGEPIEILVVDDGSPTSFEDSTINVIRLEKNSGFTAAANAGMLWAQVRNADYVLQLNNDTEPHPGFLQELLLVAEANPAIGIAASVRFHPRKLDQPYELCGADLIRGYQHFVSKEDLAKAPAVIDCNWIPLCSALMRMDMIREVGIFDKRYRNHCSDSSYCLEAKIRGWKNVLVTSSVITHHLSVTTSANNVIVDDDQRVFLERLAGLDYAKIMSAMPLDAQAKTYGKISFEVYQR